MIKRQSGIALLEALLAVLILAIGLLGTIGLQARAYAALSQADMRAEATMASEKLVSLMNNAQGLDQANLPNFTLAAGGAAGPQLAPWYNETIARMPGAVITVAVTATNTRLARVDISISWVRRAGDKLNVHRLISYLAAS